MEGRTGLSRAFVNRRPCPSVRERITQRQGTSMGTGQTRKGWSGGTGDQAISPFLEQSRKVTEKHRHHLSRKGPSKKKVLRTGSPLWNGRGTARAVGRPLIGVQSWGKQVRETQTGRCRHRHTSFPSRRTPRKPSDRTRSRRGAGKSAIIMRGGGRNEKKRVSDRSPISKNKPDCRPQSVIWEENPSQREELQENT